MRPRRLIPIAAVCGAVVSVPAAALALEARVTQFRVAGTRVAAALELTDLLEGKFLKLVRDGRAIFLQLEAALWEDRRVFDRMVVANPPVTWRLDRDAAGSGVLLLDQHGGIVRHEDVRRPLPLAVDLGPAQRVDDDAVYYIHARITAATVDEQDIERAGRAIFGNEQAGSGLVGLGRLVFRTLLRMGRYFESATTEVTSRRIAGREVRSGVL